MWRILLLAFALFPGMAFGQEPDLEALLNGIFASDLKTVVRHTPPELEAGLKKLKPAQREAMKRWFLLTEIAKEEKMRVERPEDLSAFLSVINEKENEKIDVILLDREYGRDQSILTFKIVPPHGDTIQGTVTLRYVFPEWRVYEAKVADDLKLNLDTEDFVEKAFESMLHENESRSTTVLYHYRNALSMYREAFPEMGLPHSLVQLGPAPEGEEVGREHFAMLTEQETTHPFELNGYRFHYTRHGDDRYTITARPKKFGVTGRKSFFTDETGTIRSTEKDEAATLDSPEE